MLHIIYSYIYVYSYIYYVLQSCIHTRTHAVSMCDHRYKVCVAYYIQLLFVVISSLPAGSKFTHEDEACHLEIPTPTYWPFLGILKDLKTLKHREDLLDCFHWQCLFASIFTFISCIAPAVAFGGLVQEITSSRIGVTEILVATGGAGIIYSSLATQPLVILALTGPVLVLKNQCFMYVYVVLH